jgi:hypothetical protein
MNDSGSLSFHWHVAGVALQFAADTAAWQRNEQPHRFGEAGPVDLQHAVPASTTRS